jgi:hypothetical protein
MTSARPHKWTVTIVLLATLASGRSVAAPTQADKETARHLMDQADTQVEAKHYAEALKLYQAAHDLVGVPTTGLEVAKTQAALGQLVEARDTALSVVRFPKQGHEPPVFASARRDAQALADSLEARIASVRVKVQGVDANTEPSVQVDGAAIPASAAQLPRKINPGKHKITVTAPGFQQAAREVTVEEGKTVEVPIDLVRESSKAGVSNAPSSTSRSPEQPGPAAAISPDAPKQGRRGLPTLAYVGFGVGAAGLVTGTITGLLAISKHSSIQKEFCDGTNNCSVEAQSSLDSGHTVATVSTIAFSVAALGIVTGVTAWLAAPKRIEAPKAASVRRPAGRHTSVHVEPLLGVRSVGIMGNF